MSYLREYNELKRVRYSQTIWLQTCYTIFVSVSATLAGVFKIRFKISSKKLAALGAILMSAGYLLCYLTIKHTLPLFAISYAVIYGLGYGLVYIFPISAAMKWFPQSKAKAASFVLLGLGGGSCFFNQFASMYINPKNASPDEPYDINHKQERYFSKKLHSDLLERVPITFLIMGLIILVLNLIGVLLMFENNDLEAHSDEESNGLINESPQQDSKELLTLKQAIKRPELYMLAILASFFSIAPLNFLANYKIYGQTFIHDDRFLTLIATVNAIANIFTRFFWGILFDKISFKMGHLILNTTAMALILTVGLNELIKIKIVYLLWCLLISFCECGLLILIPTGYAKVFGQKNMFLIYGLIGILSIPGSIFSSIITSLANVFGFYILFCVACSFSAIAWITAACFRVKKRNGRRYLRINVRLECD